LDFDPQSKKLGWLVADGMIKGGDNSHYRVEFYDPYKEKQVERMESSVCMYCGESTDQHVSSEGGWYCTSDHVQEVTLSDFSLGPQHPQNATPPWAQGHADSRARRYLAKKFLKHYWHISRDLAGEPTPDEWVITHGGHDKREDTFENPMYAKRLIAEP
jgi:hypothetical protein